MMSNKKARFEIDTMGGWVLLILLLIVAVTLVGIWLSRGIAINPFR